MVKTIPRYHLANEEWLGEFEALSLEEQLTYLFLSRHDRYSERWSVEGLDGSWILDLEDLVGKYRTLHWKNLEFFLNECENRGYQVAFFEDPMILVSQQESYNTSIPGFSLISSLENTIAGMLPHQLREFNKLQSMPWGGFVVHDTGTGKTAITVALTKQKMEIEDFDLTLIVCKKNNKIDTKKKLLKLGGIDYSYILDGKPSQLNGVKTSAKQARVHLYEEILDRLDRGEPTVAILNYDKFKETPDNDYLIKMIEDRKVLVIWDEMPTKLSNRKTALYKAVSSVLYGRADSKGKIRKVLARDNLRAAKMVQYCETATPIEKSPVGVLNMVRLIDPARFPYIKEWETSYVSRRDRFTKEPVAFQNLDRMHLELEDMTSRISKTDDPEIAALFPEVVLERMDLDLSEYDRRLYDRMGEIAIDLLENPYEEEEISPLQLISVMQLICCAPSLISLSGSRRDLFDQMIDEWEGLDDAVKKTKKAPTPIGSMAAQILINNLDEEITDRHCEKLRVLREILSTFKGEKVLIFSALAGYIQPVLREYFDEWGITYEVYAGTDKQCQEAKDRFRSNPDTQVLLLSDKGSDGMDLPEAMVGINFDLPWKHSTKIQRQNRNNRVDSKLPINIWIDLVYRDTVEERKEEIISTKRGYHEELYDGGSGNGVGTMLTKAEMMYILRGPTD